MCRHTDVTPVPATELREMVKKMPRRQPCGCVVSGADMSKHKEKCVKYWKCATKQWILTAGRIARALKSTRTKQLSELKHANMGLQRRYESMKNAYDILNEYHRTLNRRVREDQLRARRRMRREELRQERRQVAIENQ